jgi:hypothetical protein
VSASTDHHFQPYHRGSKVVDGVGSTRCRHRNQANDAFGGHNDANGCRCSLVHRFITRPKETWPLSTFTSQAARLKLSENALKSSSPAE